MDPSDSLKLDENLARFLAAYNQGLDGGEVESPTLHEPLVPSTSPFVPSENPVTPMHPDAPNEGSLGELLPDPSHSTQMRPPPVSGPHRIGRFELRRQLGKGGCGIVFLAYDPKLLREVALKVPRPEMLMNLDAKRRLKLEALAASELDHPNLVPVYEWGEIGPICFIATAFCPGQTLAEWIDRQAFPVPVRQAARLVATLADAVQHAHDRSVLHRDLKPNNVILQQMTVEENDEPPAGSVHLRGAHYVPRVVDFGLAKLGDRGGPSETGTRQILGTPKYMAPEQALARREDIGPPADVYALGVVLYELVAGRAPYDGATDVEVLRQSVEGKAVPPRHLRPDIPRDLEVICLKAMSVTTTERYRTAIDFADDLRRFLDGLPTVARPLAWSGRAVRWIRRNDQLVAFLVLAVVTLSITLYGTWNSYRNSSQTRLYRNERDTVVRDQADRNRADRQREYASHTSDAYHAWRSGNIKSATGALDAGRRVSHGILEPTDFAHDYLARLVKAERLMIVCPAGSVTALAVSPDGTRLASGHADGTLAVWDRATGKQLGTAKVNGGAVQRVAFARGGTLLLAKGVGIGGRGVTAWSIARDGSLTDAPPECRELAPGSLCFALAPDGKTVYAGGQRGLLMRQTLGEAKPVVAERAEPEHADIVSIEVSSDGKRVVTANSAGSVDCYTSEFRPGIGKEYPGGHTVSALAAANDGATIIGFDRDALLFVPHEIPVPLLSGGRVEWITINPGQDGFALSGHPGRVLCGFHHELPTGDTGTVRAGVFSPDGKTLFTAGADGIIRSWNLPADLRDRGVTTPGRVTSIGVHPKGGRAGSSEFVVATETELTAYEWGTGARKSVYSGGRVLRALQLLEDGTRRGVVFDGRTAVVCSGPTALDERLRVKLPDERTPTAAALTPNGGRLVLGDDKGQVSVWVVADRSAVSTFDTGLRRPVREVVVSEDGEYVAARTATGISVWAVGTTQAPANIPVDEQAAFRFLPSSARIAVAGRDGVVRVWTVAGREEMSLFGHVGRVTGLGASPDGRTLVSGGATGEVKFWDLRSGRELFGFRRHSVAVTVIEFAADGNLLVTGGEGQVAVWDARSE